MATFGESIKLWRENAGLSRSQLARLVGVSATHIGNLERDRSPASKSGQPALISRHICNRLADVFKVPVEAIYLAAQAREESSDYTTRISQSRKPGRPRKREEDRLIAIGTRLLPSVVEEIKTVALDLHLQGYIPRPTESAAVAWLIARGLEEIEQPKTTEMPELKELAMNEVEHGDPQSVVMPNDRGNKETLLTVRIDPEKYEELRALSETRGLSMSALVRWLVNEENRKEKQCSQISASTKTERTPEEFLDEIRAGFARLSMTLANPHAKGISMPDVQNKPTILDQILLEVRALNTEVETRLLRIEKRLSSIDGHMSLFRDQWIEVGMKQTDLERRTLDLERKSE